MTFKDISRATPKWNAISLIIADQSNHLSIARTGSSSKWNMMTDWREESSSGGCTWGTFPPSSLSLCSCCSGISGSSSRWWCTAAWPVGATASWYQSGSSGSLHCKGKPVYRRFCIKLIWSPVSSESAGRVVTIAIAITITIHVQGWQSKWNSLPSEEELTGVVFT